MPEPIIEGLKLITHVGANVDNPDDPSYPYRLDAVFSPPEFMSVAFMFIYGNERIRVRGMTREALDKFSEANNLSTHPRLLRLEITQPEAKGEVAA